MFFFSKQFSTAYFTIRKYLKVICEQIEMTAKILIIIVFERDVVCKIINMLCLHFSSKNIYTNQLNRNLTAKKSNNDHRSSDDFSTLDICYITIKLFCVCFAMKAMKLLGSYKQIFSVLKLLKLIYK